MYIYLKCFTLKGENKTLKGQYEVKSPLQMNCTHCCSGSCFLQRLHVKSKDWSPKLKETLNTIPHHKPRPLNIRPQIKSTSLYKMILDVVTECALECGGGCVVLWACVKTTSSGCVKSQREARRGKTNLLFKPISLLVPPRLRQIDWDACMWTLKGKRNLCSLSPPLSPSATCSRGKESGTMGCWSAVRSLEHLIGCSLKMSNTVFKLNVHLGEKVRESWWALERE